MELSPGKRRAAFLAIVVALAGLGIYLVVPGVFGSGRHAGSSAAAQSQEPSAMPIISPFLLILVMVSFAAD